LDAILEVGAFCASDIFDKLQIQKSGLFSSLEFIFDFRNKALTQSLNNLLQYSDEIGGKPRGNELAIANFQIAISRGGEADREWSPLPRLKIGLLL
jgi:hypothetical protein